MAIFLKQLSGRLYAKQSPCLKSVRMCCWGVERRVSVRILLCRKENWIRFGVVVFWNNSNGKFNQKKESSFVRFL